MKKESVLVLIEPKHVKGMGHLYHPDDPFVKDGILDCDGKLRKEYVLQKIVDWSKGKNVEVYDHITRTEFVEKPELGRFNTENYNYDLPFGDRGHYVDIFYQETGIIFAFCLFLVVSLAAWLVYFIIV